MGQHVSLLKDLKAGKACTMEAVAAIEFLEAENARLKAWKQAVDDALTLGGELNGRGSTYTGDRLKQAGKALDEALEPEND